MSEPSHTVMFAVNDDEISSAPNSEFTSDEIELSMNKINNSLAIGRYDYESNPSFGSGVQSSGYVVFDDDMHLVALTTRYDRPKPMQVFEALEEALGTSFRAPNPTPEDQHEIYRKYGFDSVNGYTVSFKQNSKTFDYSYNMGRTLDPEDEAEERCKYSNKRMSDDMVDDIAKSAMNDGMYIWSADLHIEGHTVGFSDPIRFTRIDQEFLDEHGFEKLFDIANECSYL